MTKKGVTIDTFEFSEISRTVCQRSIDRRGLANWVTGIIILAGGSLSVQCLSDYTAGPPAHLTQSQYFPTRMLRLPRA